MDLSVHCESSRLSHSFSCSASLPLNSSCPHASSLESVPVVGWATRSREALGLDPDATDEQVQVRHCLSRVFSLISSRRLMPLLVVLQWAEREQVPTLTGANRFLTMDEYLGWMARRHGAVHIYPRRAGQIGNHSRAARPCSI